MKNKSKTVEKYNKRNRLFTALLSIIISIVTVVIHPSNIVILFSMMLLFYGAYLLITLDKKIKQ